MYRTNILRAVSIYTVSDLLSYEVIQMLNGALGSVVVKALCCQPKGLGIDPQRCHWGFFSVPTDGTMCPGVDSASKNEYQGTPEGKDSRCVKVTTLPPS
jgi:hypothetical protein